MTKGRRIAMLLVGVLAVTLIVAAAQDKAPEVEQVTEPVVQPEVPEWISQGVESGVLTLVDPADFEPESTPAAKGKKPPRCTDCASTLGNCSRYSCSPCCYTCPDQPWLVCLD